LRISRGLKNSAVVYLRGSKTQSIKRKDVRTLTKKYELQQQDEGLILPEYADLASKGDLSTMARSREQCFELREYQQEAVASAQHVFENSTGSVGTVILQPTGTGKTRTAIELLVKHYVNAGKKVIWLSNTVNLVKQSLSVLLDFSPLVDSENPHKYLMVAGGEGDLKDLNDEIQIVYATWQSLIRHTNILGSWLGEDAEVLIVLDECHRLSPEVAKLLDFIIGVAKKTDFLGLSATPMRTDNSLKKYFTAGVCSHLSEAEAISKGFICSTEIEIIETNIKIEAELSDHEKNRLLNSDTSANCIDEQIESSTDRNELIVRKYAQNKEKYGSTIMFCSTIKHVFNLYKILIKNNISTGIAIGVTTEAIYIDSSLTKERVSANITKFKNGAIDVLLTVRLVAEGTDIPCAKTAFLVSPIFSRVSFVQKIGRVRRIKADGGSVCNVVVFKDELNVGISALESCDDFDFLSETGNQKGTFRRKIAVPENQIDIDIFKNYYLQAIDCLDLKIKDDINIEVHNQIGVYFFKLSAKSKLARLVVYDTSRAILENLIFSLPELFEHINENTDIVKVIKSMYFDGADFCPSDKSLNEIITCYQSFNAIKEFKYFSFEELRNFEYSPQSFAKKIINNKIEAAEIKNFLREEFEDGADLYYDSFTFFAESVSKALVS